MAENFPATQRLAQIETKYQTVAARTGTKIPYTTDAAGRFDDHSRIGGPTQALEHLSWWTNGFYPGILWELYALTEKPLYRQHAQAIEAELNQNLATMRGLDHDVGFMYLLSDGYDAALTQSPAAWQQTLHAATLLAGRFNLNGRFIRAWDPIPGGDARQGWSIIDSMMNLELLYWATTTTGDPRFAAIADAHAHTVMAHAVRPDGSIKHIIVFDPASGEYLHSLGGQGFAHGSSWTRGQSWGVYGFTQAYRHTHKPEYLATAVKIARYCLTQLQPGQALPIDFSQPASPAYTDNSATAIMASAFLSLATAVQADDAALSARLHATAVDLLTVIDRDYADYSTACDNIVTGGGVSYHDEPDPQPLIYADFYYIEALMKLANKRLPLG